MQTGGFAQVLAAQPVGGRQDLPGAVAQLGERGLCKPEVVGSIPISSTTVSPTFFHPSRVAGPKQAGVEALCRLGGL